MSPVTPLLTLLPRCTDVSEQLNTPSIIFSGRLIARLGLATNKPAEFILLRISQDTRASDESLIESVTLTCDFFGLMQ